MLKYNLKYGLKSYEIFSNQTYLSNLMRNPSDAVDFLIIESIHNNTLKHTDQIKNYLTARYFFINRFYDLINYLNYQDYSFSFLADKETIYYLKNNPDNIDWFLLNCNQNLEAIKILFENPDKFVWSKFSTNLSKYTVDIFRENLDKIEWNELFHSNLDNIDYVSSLFIRENLDKITDWNYLSFTNNEYIAEILVENIDKLNEYALKQLCIKNYDCVVDYFLKPENIHKINYEFFSKNTNDKAVLYLRNNQDKIHWGNFSINNNRFAIKILKENLDKVYLPNLFLNSNDCILDYFFSIIENENICSFINIETLRNYLHNLRYNKNPRVIDLIYKICQKFNLDFKENIEYSNKGIFEISYDYSFIRQRIGHSYCEELMAYYWNPERYNKWCEDIFSDSYVV